MIVCFGKQLIQWDFLECGHAQNLQNIVERELQACPFPDDRDKGVNCDGRPDLRSDRVLRCPVKRFDLQILFDPAEEQFHLPAERVEFGDRQSGQEKVVRQENQVTIVFPIVEPHPTKRLGILGLGFRTGQDDRLVRAQVHGFIDDSRAESSRLKIRRDFPNDRSKPSDFSLPDWIFHDASDHKHYFQPQEAFSTSLVWGS